MGNGIGVVNCVAASGLAAHGRCGSNWTISPLASLSTVPLPAVISAEMNTFLRSTPVMRPRAVSGSSMGVGHGAFHALIRSSVVVMVARSDRVLLMMASPYSAGMPATASEGTTTR